jgi:hypothetical protein
LNVGSSGNWFVGDGFVLGAWQFEIGTLVAARSWMIDLDKALIPFVKEVCYDAQGHS